MTAAALAKKHLEADLTKPEFWCETLEALEPRVGGFEAILKEAGLS